MKKILIIQNTIPHYRKAFYNSLSEFYNVTVLHSGGISVTAHDKYKEIIYKTRKIGSFYFQHGVTKEVTKNKYDIIIAMFDLWWIRNIFAQFYHSKSRFLFWGHRYSKNVFINSIRNFLIKRCDGVILYNGTEVERMIASGIDHRKIFIAENTISIENLEDCSNYEKNSFLYVGRAQKRKKINELLKAFSRIITKIPKNITVDIVGEGEENIYLKQLAKELLIEERVIFHGAINDNNKLKSFFQKAYAYVSPDAIGLGAQHSFAYGVPVVTTSIGYKGAEYVKLINKENALLYYSHYELGNILLELIKNTDLRKRLGANAYKLYSNHLSIENMAQGFIDAIENSKKP